jgi:DNA repair protein RecO (recombination protein O)
MPSQETPAIILSVKDYGEADRLVTFLTPARGRLTGVAKHARKSKKRFAHCLEPLSKVNLFLSDRAKGDLEFLEKGEAQLLLRAKNGLTLEPSCKCSRFLSF